jgi:hypothetical protein
MFFTKPENIWLDMVVTNIYRIKDKLEAIHPMNNDYVRKRCYFGKSRTISEFIHSKNKPATLKEYRITFEFLMTDLQKLVNGY